MKIQSPPALINEHNARSRYVFAEGFNAWDLPIEHELKRRGIYLTN